MELIRTFSLKVEFLTKILTLCAFCPKRDITANFEILTIPEFFVTLLGWKTQSNVFLWYV